MRHPHRFIHALLTFCIHFVLDCRETNADLLQPNIEKLQELGFKRLNEMDKDGQVLFGGLFNNLNITVQLLQEDFMESSVTLTTEEYGPDSVLLIAGACISDLIQPDLFIR